MIAAATGHRPDKLGGYDPAIRARLRFLAREVLSLLKPDKVISGMALGWDTAWAEAALDLRLPLVCAIPFVGQETRWPYDTQETYRKIRAQAAEEFICSTGGYAAFKMQTRNEWMVLQCDRLVALWNSTPGGTANCVRYAHENNRPVSNIWPVWQAIQQR